MFLSATSAGIKPSASSKRRPLHFVAALFLTGAGHCQIAPLSWLMLQQPIKNLAQLRQLIPALADLVGDLVVAALGSEKAGIAHGRYK